MDRIFMGHSDQKWINIEAGRHVNADDMYVYPKDISISYAQNLVKWYLNVTKTKEEDVRLRGSKLFKELKEITGDLNLNQMIILDREVRVAAIRAFGNRGVYNVQLTDEKVHVGDVVLTGIVNDNTFEYLDVGLVDEITKTKCISRDKREVKDIITESSKTFINLKNQSRVEEIKREIKERIKVVDKKQELEMYAKIDNNIRELLDELDNMEL